MLRTKLALGLTSIVLIASAAFAANARFEGTPTFTTHDNALTAGGSVIGLDQGDVMVEISAIAVTTCTNKAGKTPHGQISEQTVTARSGSNLAPVNGRIFFSISTHAVEGDCPGNMTPETTFEDIEITVHQNGQVVLHQMFQHNDDDHHDDRR
jgi:uncharacterized protein with beta-barrel porin domain